MEECDIFTVTIEELAFLVWKERLLIFTLLQIAVILLKAITENHLMWVNVKAAPEMYNL